MNRILIALGLLATTLQSYAQEQITIKGNLLTSDGKPAKGINIFIKNRKTIACSDNNGQFMLTVPPGSHTLLIRPNIQTQEKEITISTIQNQILDPIVLELASQELEQIVVTGQYKPQTAKNSVFNVRTISPEKIRLSNANTIQQVLMTEPGIRFNNDLTLGTADIELMGMSGRNIKILVDGIPMLDRSDTRESLNQIDINLVDRIEIVEGPMSVVYGSDALAGVINIITKKYSTSNLGIVAKIQEETVGKEYAPFSGKGNHHKSLAINWAKGNFYVNAGLTSNDFGGWNTPAKTATIAEVGTLKNLWKPKEQYLENINVGYQKSNFNIWYRILAMQEDIDTRYGINPNNYIGKLQTYKTQRWNHQIQSNWKISQSSHLEMMAGITDLSRRTITKLHNYETNNSTLSTDAGEQDIAKFDNTFFRATLRQYLRDNLTLQPGIEFNQESATGARIKGKPVINDYALFISAEYSPTSFLSIRPGTRYIKNSVYVAPKFVPAINTKIVINPTLDLRMSFAKGYRAPALRELYFDFFDASHSILGNENLKAEHSTSWNAGLTWNKVSSSNYNFNATLSGFYNIFKDRIDYAIDANNPTVTTLMNIDNYKTTGFTLDNTASYKNFKARLGFTYLGRYNQLTESNNQIPDFAWTPEINSDLSYFIEKWDATASFYIKYTGKRPTYQTDDTNPVQYKLNYIGNMTWADLMFNKKLIKGLDINLGIKNLFNVTNQTNTSTSSGGAHSSSSTINTSYGRSYVIGLTYNWKKN